MRNYTFLYIQLTKKQNLAKKPNYLLLFKDYCLLFAFCLIWNIHHSKDSPHCAVENGSRRHSHAGDF